MMAWIGSISKLTAAVTAMVPARDC
jgi:hypothetical protein